MLHQISVLILTFNEENNIGRTLAALQKFGEIVVVDSGSKDRTAEIVSQFPNARLVTRPFDQHAAQWNYGLTQTSKDRPWILALDADYVLSEELVEEIAGLDANVQNTAYQAAFRYCIYGKPLSGTLYPSKIVLFRNAGANFIQEGHTQRLIVSGQSRNLNAPIYHDDRKPLKHWFSSQIRYAGLEADYLINKSSSNLRLVDRIRLTGILGPFLALIYVLFFKRCLLDGWSGWFYALQRLVAEVIISVEIVDRKLAARSQAKDGADSHP